jgi:hypothetical protein
MENENENKEEKIVYPVCPFCKVVMEPVNFRGYYDEFCYWGCSCDQFDNVEESCGAYA